MLEGAFRWADSTVGRDYRVSRKSKRNFCLREKLRKHRKIPLFSAVRQLVFKKVERRTKVFAQSLDNATSRKVGRPQLQNVVLMGMGEPLHNYDAVMKAISILCEPTGLALGPRHITLSTVGVIPRHHPSGR